MYNGVAAVCGSGAVGVSAVTDFLGSCNGCMLIPQESPFFREIGGAYSMYTLVKGGMPLFLDPVVTRIMIY